MIFSDFINKYSGQFIDYDGQFGAQCVDLVNQYLVDVLGITSPIQELPGATAIDIYNNYSGSQFKKIDNTPNGVPQNGDIVFWGQSAVTGEAGHVAVFISGDINSFSSFDQNFPEGSPCHDQTHDYTGVVGWLHFSGNLPTGTYVDADTFARLVHNSEVTDLLNDYFQLPHNSDWAIIRAQLDALTQKVTEEAQIDESDQKKIVLLNNSVNALTTQVESLTEQVQALQDQVQQLKASPQKAQDGPTIPIVASVTQKTASPTSQPTGWLQRLINWFNS